MDNTDPFVAGLRRFLDANQEFTPSGVAVSAGLDNSTIRRMFEKPSQSPRLKTALAICDVIGVSLLDLIGFDSRQSSGDTVTQIPRYDVRLSAGHGQIDFGGTQVDIPIPFAPDFLTKKLGRTTAEGLTIVEAAGESMEPTIADGDLVMLDMNDTERSAGIFGYELAGEVFVKRLEWTEYGVQIISDNSHYPERALNSDKAEAEGFRLIGRIVWVGRVF